MTVPLLWPFLEAGWSGYSAKERNERSRKLRLDAVSIPLSVLWYCFLAKLSLRGAAVSEASDADHERTTTQCLVQAILAVAAVYALMVNILGMPATTADSDAFRAQGVAGKWVYLTRHGLVLQTWHQILSLASVVSPHLDLMTHATAPWAAAFGWFICIQYFVVVVPSKTAQEEIEVWNKRGVDFAGINFLAHAPALPIALLDVVCAKSAPLLRVAVSAPVVYIFLIGYIFFYLSIIILNYRWVGAWPYGLLKGLGTSISKWAAFVGMQSLVFMVFGTVNMLLIWVRTWT